MCWSISVIDEQCGVACAVYLSILSFHNNFACTWLTQPKSAQIITLQGPYIYIKIFGSRLAFDKG